MDHLQDISDILTAGRKFFSNSVTMLVIRVSHGNLETLEEIQGGLNGSRQITVYNAII